jgi:uncharacterized membrane protein
MEMNIDDKTRSREDRTLKDITPNVAGLLCYVAGWISGIIFLVLEQKNRFVRFHALQSIIVFGSLTIVSSILGRLPIAGPYFAALIGITGFILWIILMVKAVNGEFFKMPWIGDLAERLARDTIVQPPVSDSTPNSSPAISPAPVPPSTASPLTASAEKQYSKSEEFRDEYYSACARNGRIVASSFGIAWAVILLIFFNFYNQYIAYYTPVYSNGIAHWEMQTLITSDFNLWLPILTVTLVLSIIGHAFLIAYDKYITRQIVEIVLDAFSIATVVTLLFLFPFDFSPIPNTAVITGITLGLNISLILIAVAFGIGALVKFIQLIVHLSDGRY